jgi:hypothetical protein
MKMKNASMSTARRLLTDIAGRRRNLTQPFGLGPAVAKNPYRPQSWQQDDSNDSPEVDAPEERRDLVPDWLYIAVEVLALFVVPMLAIVRYMMLR